MGAKRPDPNIPERCPECGGQDLKRGRAWLRALGGFVIVILGCLFAIPTLGLSLVFTLWGVFLIIERTTCRECGWQSDG